MPTTHCKCCELPIEYNRSAPLYCSACEGHYPQHDEAPARTILRLTEHLAVVREQMERGWTQAAKNKKTADDGYASRNSWRIAMVETMMQHAPGPKGCKCGAGKYPCPTREFVETRHRGIGKQIERFETMTEDLLEIKLYGRPEREVYDYRN